LVRYEQRGWPIPVFQSKTETDAQYEALVSLLLQHARLLRPAFGTHNLRSLAYVDAIAEAMKVSSQAYEFQMIFGMADPLQHAVSQMGRRVRLYTPVGELIPGMAYLVRRLLENTSNESFLRKEYSEEKPLDQLLAAPQADASVRPSLTDHSDSPPASDPDRIDRFRNEPHTDFSQAPARDAMSRSVTEVKRQLGRTFSYNSPSGATSSGSEVISHDPSHPEQAVGRLRAYDPTDVPRAVHIAAGLLHEWSRVPAQDRASMLRKAAGAMRRRRFELASWEIFETGKSWREADADVAEAIDFLEFYAKEMVRLDRPHRLGQEPGETNHLLYAPCGIAAVIAPWNFPLAIPTGLVSAAVVTGNVVLFKPSERALVMGLLLTEILHEAGVPKDVLQVLPGGSETGRALVTHPDISLIAFTGSKDVGLGILAQAAQVQPGQRAVKRVIAEMGGKNAIIVDETADLDEAVSGVVTSFTGYQGQKCSACSRAIVHESVHDLFLQRLTDAAMSLQIGPPEDPGNRMGPMIDQRALAKVREYIEIGKREGRLVLEREVKGPGYFIGPAIFADILPRHRLAQEEIFGPVLAVMKASDFNEALRVANQSPYALTGGLYSRSPVNVLTARSHFDVGNLYINRPITGALVGRQPFGGHRLSGVGSKAGGEDYLAQFMISRIISENTLRRGFAPTETE
ncbi:MAG: proline dehydrogenase family protein, partial [Nitrospiraceae bacterium]